jgi:hypothetical protein
MTYMNLKTGTALKFRHESLLGLNITLISGILRLDHHDVETNSIAAALRRVGGGPNLLVQCSPALPMRKFNAWPVVTELQIDFFRKR